LSDAAESLQTALAVQEKLAADVPDVSFYRDDMAITHMNVGSLHMMQREFELARSEYRQAVDIVRTLIDAEPNNEALQVRLAAAHQALVRISYEIGDLETARQTAVRALELAENLAAARPDIVAYRKEVATCHRQIGVLYMLLDQADQADAAYRKALDILQPLAAAFPTDPTYANELASAYVNVGARLQYLESPRDAVDWFDRALDILDSESFRELPQLNTTRVLILSSRALALTERERYDEALADWERALEIGTPYDRDELVVGRSGTLAYRGNYRRALSEAEARIQESNPAPLTIYNMGCLYSIAVGAVQKDKSLDEAQRNELAELYAARAMEYLIRAKAGGVYRVPVLRNRVATHRDLAPIAGRPEFQAFLKDIESEAADDGAGEATNDEKGAAAKNGSDVETERESEDEARHTVSAITD
jgi:tetratricopeptide (TPR) repeat protein